MLASISGLTLWGLHDLLAIVIICIYGMTSIGVVILMMLLEKAIDLCTKVISPLLVGVYCCKDA